MLHSPRPVRPGQQIQIGTAPDGAVDQGLVQGVDPARAVDGGQGLKLGLHIRPRPRLGLRGRGEIDIGQDRPRRRHEQGQEQQRQPEGRAAKEGGKAHGSGGVFSLPRRGRVVDA